MVSKNIKEMKKLFLLGLLCTLLTVGHDAQGSNGKKEDKKRVTTIELTYEEFSKKVADLKNNPDDRTYLGDKPAIVDFYANWCPPCRKISPILDELADEYGDEIYIYKVNVDKEPKLSAAYDIKSLPTLLFFPMGEEPQMLKGALPKGTFKKAIDEVLLKK